MMERCRWVSGKGEGAEVSPVFFRELENKCPNFQKKCPDWGHLSAKSLIYSAIFKSFQGIKPETFPCGAFLFCVIDGCL